MSPIDTPVLFIVGPTAVGKTRLAITLAQRLNGEIINADSRQVYRYMDIGAAKPTPAERRQAAHHLLDLLNPDESFSLGNFLALARQTLRDLAGRGVLPIVTGGSGQYAWALQEGWQTPAIPPDANFRRECQETIDQAGGAGLYHRLQEVDPARAAELDPRNLRRIIRALEIYHTTGHPPSAYRQPGEPLPHSLIIGLTMERNALYQRIDARFDQMLADGFVAEARNLAAMGYRLGSGPLACPGYRELGQYLDGAISLDAAVQRAKFQTHRLARRQYSWFKPDDSCIHWLDAADPELAEKAEELATGLTGTGRTTGSAGGVVLQ